MHRSKLIFVVYWSVAAVIIVLLTLWAASRADAAISDCIDATCRITTADGSRGTGCAFENSQGHVFVLTAAHVVGDHRTVRCEFWRHGHHSVPLSGEVIARGQAADAAVVCLPIRSFRGIRPACVPVAPRGYRLSTGHTVTSVGCANGTWATGWKGHVVGYSGGCVCFTPAPADGRSGSALFDADGRRIVGLIWGRSQRDPKGYAVTVENLYRALHFKQTATGWRHRPLPLVAAADRAQCAPYDCLPRGYILPYRNYQEHRQYDQDRRLDQLERRLQGPDRVWPTMPPQLLQLERKVDRLAEGAQQNVTTKATEKLAARPSGLGVALTLAAALSAGVFLFYVVGKQ